MQGHDPVVNPLVVHSYVYELHRLLPIDPVTRLTKLVAIQVLKWYCQTNMIMPITSRQVLGISLAS